MESIYFTTNWYYDRFVLVYLKDEKQFAFGTSASKEDVEAEFQERMQGAVALSLNNYILLLEKMQKRRRAKLNGYLPKQEAQADGKGR
jgi:hypothetical protein